MTFPPFVLDLMDEFEWDLKKHFNLLGFEGSCGKIRVIVHAKTLNNLLDNLDNLDKDWYGRNEEGAWMPVKDFAFGDEMIKSYSAEAEKFAKQYGIKPEGIHLIDNFGMYDLKPQSQEAIEKLANRYENQIYKKKGKSPVYVTVGIEPLPFNFYDKNQLFVHQGGVKMRIQTGNIEMVCLMVTPENKEQWIKCPPNFRKMIAYRLLNDKFIVLHENERFNMDGFLNSMPTAQKYRDSFPRHQIEGLLNIFFKEDLQVVLKRFMQEVVDDGSFIDCQVPDGYVRDAKFRLADPGKSWATWYYGGILIDDVYEWVKVGKLPSHILNSDTSTGADPYIVALRECLLKKSDDEATLETLNQFPLLPTQNTERRRRFANMLQSQLRSLGNQKKVVFSVQIPPLIGRKSLKAFSGVVKITFELNKAQFTSKLVFPELRKSSKITEEVQCTDFQRLEIAERIRSGDFIPLLPNELPAYPRQFNSSLCYSDIVAAEDWKNQLFPDDSFLAALEPHKTPSYVSGFNEEWRVGDALFGFVYKGEDLQGWYVRSKEKGGLWLKLHAPSLVLAGDHKLLRNAASQFIFNEKKVMLHDAMFEKLYLISNMEDSLEGRKALAGLYKMAFSRGEDTEVFIGVPGLVFSDWSTVLTGNVKIKFEAQIATLYCGVDVLDDAQWTYSECTEPQVFYILQMIKESQFLPLQPNEKFDAEKFERLVKQMNWKHYIFEGEGKLDDFIKKVKRPLEDPFKVDSDGLKLIDGEKDGTGWYFQDDGKRWRHAFQSNFPTEESVQAFKNKAEGLIGNEAMIDTHFFRYPMKEDSQKRDIINEIYKERLSRMKDWNKLLVAKEFEVMIGVACETSDGWQEAHTGNIKMVFSNNPGMNPQVILDIYSLRGEGKQAKWILCSDDDRVLVQLKLDAGDFVLLHPNELFDAASFQKSSALRIETNLIVPDESNLWHHTMRLKMEEIRREKEELQDQNQALANEISRLPRDSTRDHEMLHEITQLLENLNDTENRSIAKYKVALNYRKTISKVMEGSDDAENTFDIYIGVHPLVFHEWNTQSSGKVKIHVARQNESTQLAVTMMFEQESLADKEEWVLCNEVDRYYVLESIKAHAFVPLSEGELFNAEEADFNYDWNLLLFPEKFLPYLNPTQPSGIEMIDFNENGVDFRYVKAGCDGSGLYFLKDKSQLLWRRAYRNELVECYGIDELEALRMNVLSSSMEPSFKAVVDNHFLCPNPTRKQINNVADIYSQALAKEDGEQFSVGKELHVFIYVPKFKTVRITFKTSGNEVIIHFNKLNEKNSWTLLNIEEKIEVVQGISDKEFLPLHPNEQFEGTNFAQLKSIISGKMIFPPYIIELMKSPSVA